MYMNDFDQYLLDLESYVLLGAAREILLVSHRKFRVVM